jgi:hypothetical protein
MIHHAFDIRHHVIIPEPQHSEALRLQMTLTTFVSEELRRCRVRGSIHLDDQSRRVACEVDHEIVDRGLLAELVAVLLQRAQLPPKLTLRRRAVATQMSCQLVRHGLVAPPHP